MNMIHLFSGLEFCTSNTLILQEFKTIGICLNFYTTFTQGMRTVIVFSVNK